MRSLRLHVCMCLALWKQEPAQDVHQSAVAKIWSSSAPIAQACYQTNAASAHEVTHLVGHEELGGGGKRSDASGLVDLADGGSKGHGRRSGGKCRYGGGKDGSGELHCYLLCIDGHYCESNQAVSNAAVSSQDGLVVSMSWKNHVIASNVSDRRDGAFSPLTHAKRSGRESGFDDDEFIIIIR